MKPRFAVCLLNSEPRSFCLCQTLWAWSPRHADPNSSKWGVDVCQHFCASISTCSLVTHVQVLGTEFEPSQVRAGPVPLGSHSKMLELLGTPYPGRAR